MFRLPGSKTPRIEFLFHCLKVVGLASTICESGQVALVENPQSELIGVVRNEVAKGRVAVVLNPSTAFSAALGASVKTLEQAATCSLYSAVPVGAKKRLLRSFHSTRSFAHSEGEAVVIDSAGAACWLSLPVGNGFVLLVGTNLISDLIRFRQGDQQQAEAGQNGDLWGFANERPNYLFESQLEGLQRNDRQADYWVLLLAGYLAARLDKHLLPILPHGAAGAVVLTGDDDQAYLEKYTEQLALIGDTPITYFLHPLTRHNPETLKTILGRRSIDLGLHPDALEEPQRYGSLLKEQCAWFQSLVGRAPVSVRNHGFLNDGYWGHLLPWINEGLRISSNLPGLDGRILNGSLLPARVFFDEQLTSHWSILTAIGDGVRFVSGMTDEEAGRCVTRVADEIRADGIPGIIVLNLHPQNIGETKAMHRAALEVINSGFIAWSLHDCLQWFHRRDRVPTWRQRAGDAAARAWRIARKLIKNDR